LTVNTGRNPRGFRPVFTSGGRRMDTLERVRRIIASVLGVDPYLIDPGATVDELLRSRSEDSLELVELSMALEDAADELALSVPEDAADGMMAVIASGTVRDLAEYIDRHRPS
jgi:acyl carrier protein